MYLINISHVAMSGRKARTQGKAKKAPRKHAAEKPGSDDDRFKRAKSFDDDVVDVAPAVVVEDLKDDIAKDTADSDDHDGSGDESDDGNYRFSDGEDDLLQAVLPAADDDDDDADKPKKKVASKLDLAALTPEQLKKYNEAAERRWVHE